MWKSPWAEQVATVDGSVFFGLVHNAVLLSAPAHIYDVIISRDVSRAPLSERLGRRLAFFSGGHGGTGTAVIFSSGLLGLVWGTVRGAVFAGFGVYLFNADVAICRAKEEGAASGLLFQPPLPGQEFASLTRQGGRLG